MIPRTRLLRVVAAAAALAIPSLLPAGVSVEQVIAKAREYVGPERTLDAVTSLHYVGRVELSGSVDGQPTQKTGTIDLVFQKPNQQRITQVVDKTRTVVGLADGEAWQRREDVGNPLRAQVAILNLRQLRRIQAEAFENLSFFRGAETQGGRVELRGETRVDGCDAVQLAYVYPGDISFVRSFDRKTGRLLLTETGDSAQVREQGEIVVGGLRFPERLVTVSKDGRGNVVTSTIVFERITLNEKFPPELFNLQMPGSK